MLMNKIEREMYINTIHTILCLEESNKINRVKIFILLGYYCKLYINTVSII